MKKFFDYNFNIDRIVLHVMFQREKTLQFIQTEHRMGWRCICRIIKNLLFSGFSVILYI